MIKNIGLNLSSLNYYISKSKNRPKIINEFSNIAIKNNVKGLEFYPSTFFKSKELILVIKSVLIIERIETRCARKAQT